MSYIKKDEPALLTFLFHSIFRDKHEIALNHIDPQQQVTVDTYRYFLEYFLKAGYTFVSVADLDSGLNSDGQYILATFDDGYFNNQLVLPLLEEYATPATFFITSHNILNNECFWWDVVYREMSKAGQDRKKISAVQKSYKNLNHDEIIAALIGKYGPDAITPVSDIDRPFTPGELKEFSSHPLVDIGNHTSHHYILDVYPAEVQRDQIEACQKDLFRMLQLTPSIVSYPNGNYDRDTLETSHELGFEYGITVDKRKNRLPLLEKDKLRLGRFVLWGTEPLAMQCDIFRSDFTSPFWKSRR